MHPLLMDLPELREIAERRDQVQAAKQQWQERKMDAGRRFGEAVTKRNQAVERALLAGGDPPPAIVEADYLIDGTFDLFMNRLDELAAEERRVITAHVPTIRARVDRELRHLRQELEPHLVAIATATGRLNDYRRLLDQTDRAAANGAHRPARGDLLPAEVAQWDADGRDLTQHAGQEPFVSVTGPTFERT